MNLRKIIREEIENLPSFGEPTCMIVHNNGDVFMSNHVDPIFYTTEDINQTLKANHNGYYSIDYFCYPCDVQNRRLNVLIKKVEAYEEYGYGQRYDNKGSISLTRREPFQYDPREFEIIPYFKGLVPQITNIY